MLWMFFSLLFMFFIPSWLAEILKELGQKEESEFYLEKAKLFKESSKNE